MNYKLFSLILAAGMIAAQSAHADNSVTVGNDPEDDYSTIQSAIDASSTGWFISVDDGAYTEDLTIPAGKNITISGNPSDGSAVEINGRILVQQNATAQLDYLSVDATGNDYGIKVVGDATIQHGYITHGTNGLLVGKNGFATVYEETIKHANRNGVRVKQTGRLIFNYSRSSYNGKAGIRYNSHKKIRVADSRFKSNATGLYLIDANNGGNTLFRTEFVNNTTGLKLDTSRIDREDNQFTGNTTNVVEL